MMPVVLKLHEWTLWQQRMQPNPAVPHNLVTNWQAKLKTMSTHMYSIPTQSGLGRELVGVKLRQKIDCSWCSHF